MKRFKGIYGKTPRGLTLTLWGSQEKRERKGQNLFEEIMAKNFPNLGKETDIQVQEAQRTPNKMNLKRSTPRYIILKMSKIEDNTRTLKAAREKQLVMGEGKPIRLAAYFF